MPIASPRSLCWSTLLLLAVAFEATAQTTFTDLGAGTGDVWVSGDGTTVAGINGSTGFRWTQAGGVTSLSFQPADLSYDGSVIAGTTGATPSQVIRWTQAGGPVGFGNGLANAISADGSIIVGTLGSGSQVGASRWDATGMLTNSPLSPAGVLGCSNMSISNNGFVAGHCPGISYRTATTTATTIDLRTAGGRMSADGNFILGYDGTTNELILWNLANPVTVIPGVAGYANAVGFNLSASAECVVGEVHNFLAPTEAMIWTPARGTRTLRTALTADAGLGAALTGWTLKFATDVDDNCDTIVGFGTNASGATRAFIVRGFRASQPSATGVVITDSISPANDKTLPFGTALVNVTHTSTVTVTNQTGAALVLAMGTDALAAPFSLTNAANCITTLPAGGACTITVAYTPTVTGLRSDTFTLRFNGVEQPPISVSGTGRVAAVSISDSISPAQDQNLPFGTTVNAGASGTATVTLTNNDTVSLTVFRTRDLAVPFSFQNSGACNVTLAPAQSCTLTVTFAPGVAGTFDDFFTLDVAGSSQRIDVHGSPQSSTPPSGGGGGGGALDSVLIALLVALLARMHGRPTPRRYSSSSPMPCKANSAHRRNAPAT